MPTIKKHIKCPGCNSRTQLEKANLIKIIFSENWTAIKRVCPECYKKVSTDSEISLYGNYPYPYEACQF